MRFQSTLLILYPYFLLNFLSRHFLFSLMTSHNTSRLIHRGDVIYITRDYIVRQTKKLSFYV